MAQSFASFTITQPFLGAPLQFQPALGSKELEILIDTFVPGPVAKQDKLSQVTIDFYNHATVDLSTGALVRRYTVALPSWHNNAYTQSPTTSQSSSSPLFTPSPASSATFGDSFRGSVSMTPPPRNRVTKKAKKETKKAAEAKIPGFQIMTKDGIDITNSAGRGTKTKEQREHAHLMRIMKACDACKKKKVRCDPSHRRSHTEMSRTSAKTSSSNQNNTSPTTSTPPLSLSRETTNASIESVPSFGASAIDDFVLFPEDSASWNPADMSMPDLDPHFDLNHFSFDINDINPTSNYADYPLDFTSSFSHLAAHEPTHTTFNANQYSLSQWDEALASQSATNTKPFESLQSTDGLGSSWSFGDTSGLEFFDSSASGGSLTSAGQTPQNSSSSNASPVSASNLDWAINDLASFRDFSPDLNRGTFVAEGLIVKEPTTPRSPAAIQRLVDSVPSYSSELQTFVDPSDHVHQTETPDKSRSDNHYPTDGYGGQGQGSNRPTETLEVENACAIVTLSLKALDSAPPGYSTLATKLRSLQDVLQNVHRLEGILPESVASSIQNLSTELDRHFAHPCEPHHPVVPVLQEAAEQCIIETRMLVQLPSVNRRSQAQSSSAVPSDRKSCSPLSCPWENQEDASSDTPDRHQSRATVDHLTQIISGSSRLYGSLSSVNHIPDAPKGIHLQDDAIHLSSVVTGLQIPSTPATQGISVMPPHHLFLNKIAIDASNPPGSSILQHSPSKEDSSRHNLVTTQTIAQKPLFRFDHNSPRPSLSSQPSIYALAGASLFEPVLTKTVGSSTNTSLLVREEYAWGAIPQAVREQAILPVGRNNLYDQLLEGGERRNITPSLTTISAARPAVPGLQAVFSEVMTVKPYILSASHLSPHLSTVLNLAVTLMAIAVAAWVSTSSFIHVDHLAATTSHEWIGIGSMTTLAVISCLCSVLPSLRSSKSITLNMWASNLFTQPSRPHTSDLPSIMPSLSRTWSTYRFNLVKKTQKKPAILAQRLGQNVRIL